MWLIFKFWAPIHIFEMDEAITFGVQIITDEY